MPLRNSTFEALENRTLMSVSPLSTAVQLDRLQVQSDLLAFRSSCLSTTVTLTADIQKIKADTKPADAATFTPLVKQFHTDIRAMRLALLGDRLTQASNALADESVIVGELKQMLLDRGNATAIAVDKSKLLTDRIKLQNDLIAGLDTRITTRENAYSQISTDCQNIVTAVTNDPGSAAKLIADVTKFATDRTTTLGTLSGALAKIMTDRQQLVTDLTAMQTS